MKLRRAARAFRASRRRNRAVIAKSIKVSWTLLFSVVCRRQREIAQSIARSRWTLVLYLIGLIIFVNSAATLLAGRSLNAVKHVELTCTLHIDCPTGLRV